jgi:hypothetical protein
MDAHTAGANRRAAEESLALEEHPAWRFCSLEPVDFDIVSPGDRLQAGDFDLPLWFKRAFPGADGAL